MADGFGVKIGIDGEREFKKAIENINKSMNVLVSEMKLATSAFEANDLGMGFEKSMDAVSEDMASAVPANFDITANTTTPGIKRAVDFGSPQPIYANVTVELDGKTVGRVLAPTVGQNLTFNMRGAGALG